MIKVNLLKDPIARTHRTYIKPSTSRTGPLLIVFIVLVVGLMGAWYYVVNERKNELTEYRNELKAEEARLQALKIKLEKYEEDKKQIQSRISVIEQLKEQQTGPVLLLNHVLHSIPRNRLLWLTSLIQKDSAVQIVGQTQKIEAIPDFMTNLAETGFFQSVDLEMIDSVGQDDASKFSLLCMSAQYQPEE
ncbi:MAG: PilN domain-containing protein [Acidobacteria bacterium]|nr:PilN domain-containing protein [Acidobacteriota bacterium]